VSSAMCSVLLLSLKTAIWKMLGLGLEMTKTDINVHKDNWKGNIRMMWQTWQIFTESGARPVLGHGEGHQAQGLSEDW